MQSKWTCQWCGQLVRRRGDGRLAFHERPVVGRKGRRQVACPGSAEKVGMGPGGRRRRRAS